MWKITHLGEKPERTWMEAVVRFLKESTHKSIVTDKFHLKWLGPHLKDKKLTEINREILDDLIEKRKAGAASNKTVNSTLEVVRKILRKAEREWEWIDRAPYVKMLTLNNKRIRWITAEESEKLIAALPAHLKPIVSFALKTGLRKENILELKWSEVDLVRKHAMVHPDESKTSTAIPIPLNNDAIKIIKSQIGRHPIFVFTYNGKPIDECTTKAWRKALERAGIKNFTFHDLRHTWASWHVQNGTSLQELQQLGGWKSYQMVLRYAHLSSRHLSKAAENISGAKMVLKEKADLVHRSRTA